LCTATTRYLADDEYRCYWSKLRGMRKAISESLGIASGITILDVGTGWGLFAIEIARQARRGTIIGIDIVSEEIARKTVRDARVSDIVDIMRMDATDLSFRDNCFHLTTSFLGMRDIHMTRGEEGVERATKEMTRVTKPNGRIALTITPPEDMETEDQRIAVEVEGEVFGARSLPKRFYTGIFKDNNVTVKEIITHYTHRKLTSNQAMTELREGIEIARKIYLKNVPDLADVWDRYGERIEAFGYGMYSKTVTMIGEKSD